MNSGNKLGKVLLVVISAVILFIMCILVVQKAANYIQIREKITVEKNSLEQDKQKLAQLEELSRHEKEMTATIDACKKLMPSEPQEDWLIEYIQNTADTAMANFVEIQFSPRVQGSSYSEMPVKISFQGSYTSFVNFLKSLRNGERAVRVDSVTATPTGSGSTDIKAELAASAFYSGTATAAANSSGTGSTAGSTAATGTAGSTAAAGTNK